MLNNVVLMGRLTADPELRHTQNDISVTSFTIAVDRDYTPKGQEKQADFINCVAWRGTADFITRYFQKGSMIAIQGTIQTRKYEDKEGNKRTAFEVVADKASFCGGKKENGQYQADEKPAHSKPDVENDDFEEMPSDEDLPF